MAEICSCSTGSKAMGQPPCVSSFGRDARLVFVDYLTNTGAINSIASTETLDAAFITARLNAGIGSSVLDKSLRWDVTETINSVVGERADNVTQDIDGIPLNVKQGVRTYDGTFYGNVASTPYINAFESMACKQKGYFIIDVVGNLIGMKRVDESGNVFLDPIKIQSSTLQVKYKFPSSTEVQAINVKFAVEENERDANLNYIPATSFGSNLLQIRSVIEVSGVVTGTPTTTEVVLDLSFIYGSVFAPNPFTGADLADFVVYNNTTSSSVTPTTVEEDEGTYTLTLPAQTASDSISVDLDREGFVMNTVTYTI